MRFQNSVSYVVCSILITPEVEKIWFFFSLFDELRLLISLHTLMWLQFWHQIRIQGKKWLLEKKIKKKSKFRWNSLLPFFFFLFQIFVETLPIFERRKWQAFQRKLKKEEKNEDKTWKTWNKWVKRPTFRLRRERGGWQGGDRALVSAVGLGAIVPSAVGQTGVHPKNPFVNVL